MASPIGFFFLLLTTSQLVIRPAAFNPALVTIPFLQIFIIPCLIFSLTGVQEQLTGRSLSRNPITVYLLGFTVCHFLSSMINLGPDQGMTLFNDFIKSAVYYILIIANVKTRRRFVQFGIAYTLCILFSASVAMANYYHLVDMPGYTQLGEYAGEDRALGVTLYNYRLSGPTGTSSGDPNDFSLMMLPAILFSGHFVLWAPRLWQKLLALISAASLVQATLLTQSRGGMLGLLAGIAVMFLLRYGIKRSIPFLVLGAIGLGAMAAGRQMDFSMESGSGQVRIQIWLVCISLIVRNPVLGVGPSQLVQYADFVAHNSFLQAFTELGLLGGVCCLGVFFCAAWCLIWTRPHPSSRLSPELWRLRPMMIAIIFGTALSMNALTRAYAMETFVVVGMASSFYYCVSDQYRDTPIRTNSKLFGIILVASAAFLFFIRLKVLTSI